MQPSDKKVNTGSLYFLAKTVAEPFGSDQTLI